MADEKEQGTELTLQQHAEQELATVEEGITALREKWKNVVFEVETTKGMDQAKAARMEIRQPRYEVQRIVKAKKSELAQISRDLGARGEAIIDQIMEIEGPIHLQIEAVEARKAAEKEARDKRDREERQRQMDRILSMRGLTGTLIGATVDELDAATQQVLADDLSDLDDVYRPDGQMAKDKALEDLAVMRAQRATADDQTRELEALRAQQADLEAQRATEKAAEDAARAQREQEERENRAAAEAISAAIDSLRAYAHMGRDSREIYAAADELASITINADRYGDRVEAALAIVKQSLDALEKRARAAVESETLATEQAERQRQLDKQAAEQRRKAEEAEAEERERQRVAEVAAAQRAVEAQAEAIRNASVWEAMTEALALLHREGYGETVEAKKLAVALEKHMAADDLPRCATEAQPLGDVLAGRDAG